MVTHSSILAWRIPWSICIVHGVAESLTQLSDFHCQCCIIYGEEEVNMSLLTVILTLIAWLRFLYCKVIQFSRVEDIVSNLRIKGENFFLACQSFYNKLYICILLYERFYTYYPTSQCALLFEVRETKLPYNLSNSSNERSFWLLLCNAHLTWV